MKFSILLKRLWPHILLRRRKQLGLLFILVIFTSLTEIVTIGAILPFLAVLAEPKIVFDHELMQPLIQVLGLTEPPDLILPITVAFALAAIISGLMRIAMLWGQSRLGQNIVDNKVFPLIVFAEPSRDECPLAERQSMFFSSE